MKYFSFSNIWFSSHRNCLHFFSSLSYRLAGSKLSSKFRVHRNNIERNRRKEILNLKISREKSANESFDTLNVFSLIYVKQIPTSQTVWNVCCYQRFDKKVKQSDKTSCKHFFIDPFFKAKSQNAPDLLEHLSTYPDFSLKKHGRLFRTSQ